MIYFLTDNECFNGKHLNVLIGHKAVNVPTERLDYYGHAIETYRRAYKARQRLAPPGVVYQGLGLFLKGGRGAHDSMTRNLAQYALPDDPGWFMGVPTLIKFIEWLEADHRDVTSKEGMGAFWNLRMGRPIGYSAELQELDARTAQRGGKAPNPSQIPKTDPHEAKSPGYHAKKIMTRRRARAERDFQKALDNGMRVTKPVE